MTLTQLRYFIAVTVYKSLQKTSAELYISQPSLTKAISSLENELGVKLFSRSVAGMALTDEGYQFLTYAKQVIEQVDVMMARFSKERKVRRIFSISSHHYAFVVNAFVNLINEYNKDEYEFSLREERTHDIIEDVKNGRSELGILYLSNFNRDVITNILKSNGLEAKHLFTASPHVFVCRDHPLSKKEAVSLDDLTPYPRFTYDQGTNNSFYFAEELHSTIFAPKSVVLTDRATLFNLLIGLKGYTISSGILSTDLNGDQIVAVPLKSDEKMDLVAISIHGDKLSSIATRYLEILDAYIKEQVPKIPQK